MKRNLSRIILVFSIIVLVSAFGGVASAQDGASDYPVDTITVTGNGSASGAPDLARMEVGVETINADISAAFSQTNDTLQAVIDAVVEQGVAREDIRTTGLSVFARESFGAPMMEPATSGMAQESPQREYSVHNRVRIVVRDLDNLEAVITAAIGAGANTVFGPDFGFDSRDALETTAREDAMADARARAEELAGLAGVELGDIIIVNETNGGFNPFETQNFAASDGGFGGGGAVIEPGQLSVSVQLQVTFRISR